ncbi:hypothetical protein acdb102_19560 [Acidothermaceae bacterium B102]|nr:hypothetical protein acdb102_19560 [Acidothermaceae bacterium B102]
MAQSAVTAAPVPPRSRTNLLVLPALAMACALSAACTGHRATPSAAPTTSANSPTVSPRPTSAGVSPPTSTATGATSEGPASSQASAPSADDVAARAAQILAEITIPPLPSFTIPTEVITSAETKHIASVLQARPGLYAGIAVLDERCTASGASPADAGGSLGRSGEATYNQGGVHVSVAGDGTGTYRDGPLSVSVLAGGAGVYDDGNTRVNVAADGSGSYVDATRRIAVAAGGVGTYRSGSTRLWVNADHSAGYDEGSIHVSVSRTGVVFTRGDPVTTAAVLRVIRQPFPAFPPVARVARVHPTGTVCGTVVRLDANVLFAFGSHALLPQGITLVSRVGRLLAALHYPVVQVNGYTDHIGGAAANVALSRARASTVCSGLTSTGVRAGQLRAAGFGETHPLHPETTPAGKDDPAARQLDRRVELVLPDASSAAIPAGGSPAPCG